MRKTLLGDLRDSELFHGVRRDEARRILQSLDAQLKNYRKGQTILFITLHRPDDPGIIIGRGAAGGQLQAKQVFGIGGQLGQQGETAGSNVPGGRKVVHKAFFQLLVPVRAVQDIGWVTYLGPKGAHREGDHLVLGQRQQVVAHGAGIHFRAVAIQCAQGRPGNLGGDNGKRRRCEGIPRSRFLPILQQEKEGQRGDENNQQKEQPATDRFVGTGLAKLQCI